MEDWVNLASLLVNIIMPKFSKKGINGVLNNKPIMYTIKKGGKPTYVGVAKRGRAQERLEEHLGEIPGSEFTTRSYDTVAEAKKAEEEKIKREKPRHNDQHKN